MMRSTELCEMSRSCQSATFSKRRLGVGAHHARQAANLLAADGIALVRHGRTAALAGGERLLGLAHFGALQVANFEGDFFERGGDDRQRGDVLRVAVALDHLRSDRRAAQAQAPADGFFDLQRPDARRCPPRRKFCPRPSARAASAEALDVAAVFGKPVGDLAGQR